MGKSSIGIRKDYQKQYEEMQRDLRGVKPKIKKEYYKEFYRQLAKTADQRLIELERLSKKKGYKNVSEWAYANAMRDIRAAFGEDAKRFNRKLPDNLNKIYKDINRVLRFLNAPTSSITGISEVYDKRAATINKKYGTDVNWDKVGHIFESKLWKKTNSNNHGSATVLKAIGVLQANKTEVMKALKEHKPISITIPEEWVDGKLTKQKNVEEEVNKLLRHYKKDVNSLLKQVPKKK